MSITPPTFSQVVVATPFTSTVTITDDNTGDAANIIAVTSDSALPSSINVQFSNVTGAVTVTGLYPISVFPGATIKYITRGSSDKIEAPVTVGSFGDIPQGKQVIAYVPSGISQIIYNYKVIIDANTEPQSNIIEYVTQSVQFNYDVGAAALKSYI
jgi:hypothetical protein